VFFNSPGNRLIGTRTATSQIDSFVVLPGGHLFAAQGSPFTGQGLGQLGAEFSPGRPGQLFVSNAHNGTGLGTVSAYRDGFLGRLSPIGASPYADGQTAPCWVEISHDGRYLFTVNTGSGNIRHPHPSCPAHRHHCPPAARRPGSPVSRPIQPLSLARPPGRARDTRVPPPSWRAGCWPVRRGS
jgi:hypothetical protein